MQPLIKHFRDKRGLIFTVAYSVLDSFGSVVKSSSTEAKYIHYSVAIPKRRHSSVVEKPSASVDFDIPTKYSGRLIACKRLTEAPTVIRYDADIVSSILKDISVKTKNKEVKRFIKML